MTKLVVALGITSTIKIILMALGLSPPFRTSIGELAFWGTVYNIQVLECFFKIIVLKIPSKPVQFESSVQKNTRNSATVSIDSVATKDTEDSN